MSGYLTIKGYDKEAYTCLITFNAIELKLNVTAQDALKQINSRGYAIPYSTSGKKVVKVGVSFSMETKTIEDWIVEA